MYLIKNIATKKSVISSVLIIQLLALFYTSFASPANESCGRLTKVVQKHCCCCNDKSPSQKSCGMEDPLPSSQSLSKCDCIHKSNSANTEVTTQQNYELNKIAEVDVIDFDYSTAYSDIIIFKIHSLKSLNGPPIYLSDSAFLI